MQKQDWKREGKEKHLSYFVDAEVCILCLKKWEKKFKYIFKKKKSNGKCKKNHKLLWGNHWRDTAINAQIQISTFVPSTVEKKINHLVQSESKLLGKYLRIVLGIVYPAIFVPVIGQYTWGSY